MKNYNLNVNFPFVKQFDCAEEAKDYVYKLRDDSGIGTICYDNKLVMDNWYCFLVWDNTAKNNGAPTEAEYIELIRKQIGPFVFINCKIHTTEDDLVVVDYIDSLTNDEECICYEDDDSEAAFIEEADFLYQEAEYIMGCKDTFDFDEACEFNLHEEDKPDYGGRWVMTNG